MTSVNATTRTDLEAIAAVRSWGVQSAVIRVPAEPCTRPDCGGSILIFEGERVCILCARELNGAAPLDIPMHTRRFALL